MIIRIRMPGSRRLTRLNQREGGLDNNCYGNRGMMKLEAFDERFVNEVLNVWFSHFMEELYNLGLIYIWLTLTLCFRSLRKLWVNTVEHSHTRTERPSNVSSFSMTV
ncbi:hypothetical protein MS3_00008426 [Schistosoma haematobium]|uniref:Uncharacterized protein n=1 Tax=Schistosoma haematobium TaxID=6185 RepID=A0A922IK11_SCHHA|nr:hypothetical protein MS3_00008426 [Schistosoma haematobium]KAH9581224.1 hypothetical protein MS3_00008426 [Schistosoma haematobium]